MRYCSSSESVICETVTHFSRGLWQAGFVLKSLRFASATHGIGTGAENGRKMGEERDYARKQKSIKSKRR